MKKHYAKKISTAAFAVVGVLIACMMVAFVVTVTQMPTSASVSPIGKASINVGGSKVLLDVATTQAQQALGLSGRASLDKDSGMFFPFVEAQRPGFWMKDMNFPLDFIYMKGGKVVELKENVQPPIVPVPFFPNEEVDGVLEVNAGWVKDNHIEVGDSVSYPL